MSENRHPLAPHYALHLPDAKSGTLFQVDLTITYGDALFELPLEFPTTMAIPDHRIPGQAESGVGVPWCMTWTMDRVTIKVGTIVNIKLPQTKGFGKMLTKFRNHVSRVGTPRSEPVGSG